MVVTVCHASYVEPHPCKSNNWRMEIGCSRVVGVGLDNGIRSVMKKVKAFLNYGRWLARCPKHNGGVADVDPERAEFICPVCYPQSIAVIPVKRGIGFEYIPDHSARRTAEMQARAKNDIYTVVFPKDIKKFMKRFAKKQLSEMNWTED